MKKQLFLLFATTIVAATFAGCSCTGSKTTTDTTTESTIESTTPTGTDKESESEQPTTTVADIETDSNTESNTTEQESTVEELTTEAPTEAPTEEPTVPINPEKPVVKDYTISWSNPYFFTKKFSDGTEKYYFTYMEEADIFGVETTAIGIIPESQYEYLEHSPDYYINGKTGSNTGSVREETTEQQTSGNTGNNQTEQETSSGNTPQLVTIDGVQYMMNSDGSIVKLGGGTMTEEEWNEYLKWREENGFTMTN